jgi:hypothetical protein
VRLSAQELKRRYRELRDLVNEWDPQGLLNAGAPEDEYDRLVGPLLRRLEAKEAPEQVAVFLTSEMAEHFGMGVPDALPFAIRAHAWCTERWPNNEATPLGDAR